MINSNNINNEQYNTNLISKVLFIKGEYKNKINDLLSNIDLLHNELEKAIYIYYDNDTEVYVYINNINDKVFIKYYNSITDITEKINNFLR